MTRAPLSPARAALLLLSALLLVLTLTARKPGTPPTLKADEPAYYLGALSLAYDFDFRADTRDLERAFEDYPYAPIDNLIVMSSDGWRTLYYGKPYIFSCFAAPFVYLFGTNGIVFFNMAMLLAMVWMGFHLLSRANGEMVAALFAVGFFLLSNAYLYVWWLHPEVFNMVAAMGCLFFGLPRDPRQEALEEPADKRPARLGGPFSERFLGTTAGLWISAAMLTAGAYNKPILAACCLPVIVALLRRRAWRSLATYAVAGITCSLLWVGLSLALTGKPSAYLVGQRAGFLLADPGKRLIEPEPLVVGEKKKGEERESAGWFWLIEEKPDTRWHELVESSKFFLVGRHTGLFVYGPFGFLALLLFLLTPARRSWLRWSILAAAALVAFFFLYLINFNWHGGGGFVGNRYFVMAYPLLIFLVGRIRFPWLMVPFYAFAGALLGPLLLSPHGLVVFSPTLQSHVRGPAFQLFPLEHSLREVPGYDGKVEGELYITGMRDQLRAVGDSFWIQGGRKVQLWVQTVEPMSELSLHFRSPVEGNRGSVSLGGESFELALGKTPQRVVFHPAAPTLKRQTRYPMHSTSFIDIYLYRVEVMVLRGRPPMPDQPNQPYFYLGAELDVPAAEQKF